MSRDISNATYLGDGLYAEWNGEAFELFAHDGLDVRDRVFLDLNVLEAFFKYAEKKLNVEITMSDYGREP